MKIDKSRLQITLDKDTQGLIATIAKRDNKSCSAVAADLIRQATELQEDFYFSNLADQRLAENNKRFNHEDVWNDI